MARAIVYWFRAGRTLGGERRDFDLLEIRTDLRIVVRGIRGDKGDGDGVLILVEDVLMDGRQRWVIRTMTSTQTKIRPVSICSREGRTGNLDRPRGGVPVAV